MAELSTSSSNQTTSKAPSLFERESVPVDSASQSEFSRPILTWIAPLYTKYDRPRVWYIGAGIICMSLIIYGLLANAWTLSVLVLVLAGLYYYTDQKPVQNTQISISEQGIIFAGRMYPFSMFKSFWVDYHPPVIKELHILPNSQLKYELTLQLGDEDPTIVRQILRRFLPELVDREKSLRESFPHITGL